MYSREFREIAIKLYYFFHSLRKTANVLKISISSISRWTKRIDPLKRCRVKTKVNDALRAFVRCKVLDKCILTCRTLQELVKQELDLTISRQLVHVILREEGFSYKRIRKRGYTPKSDELTTTFVNRFSNIPEGSTIVSIDESGFDQRPISIYGYSMRGTKAVARYKTSPDRNRYSLLLAMTNHGKLHYEIHKDTINGKKFCTFMQNINIPKSSTILLDNASIHKSQTLKDIVAQKQCNLMFTPPYSPQFNPIELVFGILKQEFYKQRYDATFSMSTIIEKCISKLDINHVIKTFNHVKKIVKNTKIKIEANKN